MSDRVPLNVAIDFGTTFSSAALSFSDEDQIFLVDESSHPGTKFPTVVVLRRQAPHEAVEMGYSALDRWRSSPDEFVIFNRFKMCLHQPGTSGSTVLTSDFGADRLQLPASTVFARCLQLLKDRVLQRARLIKGQTYTADQISWRITVPAIWSMHAKQFMLRAAVEAGLVDNDLSPRVNLALEPEAAAVEVAHSCQLFQAGDVYILLDCGGGTVDVVAHRVMSREPLRVKEVYRASGGHWGGTLVDEACIRFLKRIIGTRAAEITERHPHVWFEFITDIWERKKTAFGTNVPAPDGFTPINLANLVEVISSEEQDDDEQEFSMRTAVAEFVEANPEYAGRVRATSSIIIQLENSIMQSFFEQSLERATAHVERLLINPALAEVSKIALVGGFGECVLLQNAIEAVVESRNIEVIKPLRPSLAVVMGAAREDRNIFSRISRLSYGARLIADYSEFYADYFPANRVETDDQGRRVVKNVFDKFVSAGEEVEHDQVVMHYVSPISNEQRIMTVPLFASSDPDVKFTNEANVRRVGSIIVPMRAGEDVELRMRFGGPNIVVTCKSSCGEERITVDFN